MPRQPWRTYPDRWNRQIIYQFPNGYGASIITEVDWDQPIIPGQDLPRRDDVVEVGVIRFDGNQYCLTSDEDGEHEIYREVPIGEVDAILDDIEHRAPAPTSGGTDAHV